MWEWSDKLKLGKSSAFVKRDIRSLPLTDAEVEADFFHDPRLSTEDRQLWIGMVAEREAGAVLALEDVRFCPSTVNDLATLLAHAMLRPLTEGNRQRPSRIFLRDRPQWQELLPHLGQLGIRVVLADELPRFDHAVAVWMHTTRTATRFGEALIEWMVKAKAATRVPVSDEIKAALQKPFPERRRTSFDDAVALMDWSDAMFKAVYPSRKVGVPLCDPERPVSLRLTADELEAILTQTDIAKTKKLRPRMEAMAAEGKTIDLEISDWSRIILALCGPRSKKESDHRRMLKIAEGIANHLAEALHIEGPSRN